MRWILFLALLSLSACGGGTSHWTWSWTSDSGNVTIDASGDNVKPTEERWDAFHYAQGDPRYERAW